LPRKKQHTTFRFKDRFRPSLDCELRANNAAACGWLEKWPQTKFAPRWPFGGVETRVEPACFDGDASTRVEEQPSAFFSLSFERNRRRCCQYITPRAHRQRRFFVAAQHYLRYYKDDTPGRMLLGAIDLRRVDIPETVNEHIHIVMADTTVKLRAPSHQDALQWMTHLHMLQLDDSIAQAYAGKLEPKTEVARPGVK